MKIKGKKPHKPRTLYSSYFSSTSFNFVSNSSEEKKYDIRNIVLYIRQAYSFITRLNLAI